MRRYKLKNKKKKNHIKRLLVLSLAFVMIIQMFNNVVFADNTPIESGYQLEAVYDNTYTSAKAQVVTSMLRQDIQLLKLIDSKNVEYNPEQPDITYTENGTYTYTLQFALLSEYSANQEAQIHEETITIKIDKIGYAIEEEKRQQKKDTEEKQQDEATQADEMITSQNIQFIGRFVGVDLYGMSVYPQYPVEFMNKDADAIKQFHTNGFSSGTVEEILSQKYVGDEVYGTYEYTPVIEIGSGQWTDKYNVGGNGADKSYGALTTKINDKEKTVVSMRQSNNEVYYKVENDSTEYKASMNQTFYINYCNTGYSSALELATYGSRLNRENFDWSINGIKQENKNAIFNDGISNTQTLSQSHYMHIEVNRPSSYMNKLSLQLIDEKTNKIIVSKDEMRKLETTSSVAFEFKIPSVNEYDNDYSLALQWSFEYEAKDPENIKDSNVVFIGRVIEYYNSRTYPQEFRDAEKKQIEEYVAAGFDYGDVEKVMLKDKNIGNGEYVVYQKKDSTDTMGAVTTKLNGNEVVVKEMWQFDGKVYYVLEKSTGNFHAGVMIEAEDDQIFYLNYSRGDSSVPISLKTNGSKLSGHDVKLYVNHTDRKLTDEDVTIHSSEYVTISIEHTPEYQNKFGFDLYKGDVGTGTKIDVIRNSSEFKTEFLFKVDSSASLGDIKQYTMSWNLSLNKSTKHLIAMVDENANFYNSDKKQQDSFYDTNQSSGTGEAGNGRALPGATGNGLDDTVTSQYVGTTRLHMNGSSINGLTSTDRFQGSALFISDTNSGLLYGTNLVKEGLISDSYRLKTKDAVAYGGVADSLNTDLMRYGVTYVKNANSVTNIANKIKWYTIKSDQQWGTWYLSNTDIANSNIEAGFLTNNEITEGSERIQRPDVGFSYTFKAPEIKENTVLNSGKFQTYKVQMQTESGIQDVEVPMQSYKEESYYAFLTPGWNGTSQTGNYYPTLVSSFDETVGNNQVYTMEYDMQWGKLPVNNENNATGNIQTWVVGSAQNTQNLFPPMVLKYETWANGKNMIRQNNGNYEYDAPNKTEYINLWADKNLQKLNGTSTKTMSDGTQITITLTKKDDNVIGNSSRYVYQVKMENPQSDVRLSFQSLSSTQPTTFVNGSSVDNNQGTELGDIAKFNGISSANKVGYVTPLSNAIDLRKNMAGGLGAKGSKYYTGQTDMMADGLLEKVDGTGREEYVGPKGLNGNNPKEVNPSASTESAALSNYYAIPVWVKKGYKNPIPYLYDTNDPSVNILKGYWQDSTSTANDLQNYVNKLKSNDEGSQDRLRLAYTRLGTAADGEHEGDMLYMYYLYANDNYTYGKLEFASEKMLFNVKYRNDNNSPDDISGDSSSSYVDGTQKDDLDFFGSNRFLVTDKIPANKNDIFIGWKLAFYDSSTKKKITLKDENGNDIQSENAEELGLKTGEYLPEGRLYNDGDLIDLNTIYSAYDYALARYFTTNLKISGNIEVQFIPVYFNDIKDNDSYKQGEIQFKYQTLDSSDTKGYSYQRLKGDKETKIVPTDGYIFTYPTSTDAVKMPRLKTAAPNESYYQASPWYMFNAKESQIMSRVDSPIPGESPDGEEGINIGEFIVAGVHVYDRAYKVNFDYKALNTVQEKLEDKDKVNFNDQSNQIADQDNTFVEDNHSIVKLPDKYNDTINSKVQSWALQIKRYQKNSSVPYNDYLLEIPKELVKKVDGHYQIDLSQLDKGTVIDNYPGLDATVTEGKADVGETLNIKNELLRIYSTDPQNKNEEPVMSLSLVPLDKAPETESKNIEYVYNIKNDDGSVKENLLKDKLLVSGEITGETASSNIYLANDGTSYKGLEIARMYFKFEGEDSISPEMQSLETRKKFKVVWEKIVKTKDGETVTKIENGDFLTDLAEQSNSDGVKVFYDQEKGLYWTPLIVKADAIQTTSTQNIDGVNKTVTQVDKEKLEQLCEGQFRVNISYDNQSIDYEDSSIYKQSRAVNVKVAEGISGVATIPSSIHLAEQKDSSGDIIAKSVNLKVELVSYSHDVFDATITPDTDWNTPQSGDKNQSDDYISVGSEIYKQNLPFVLSSQGTVEMNLESGIGVDSITAKVFQRKEENGVVLENDVSANGLQGNIAYGNSGSMKEIFEFYLKTTRPRNAKNGTTYKGVMKFRLNTGVKN